LPTLASAVPTGPQWAYEIKHDGFRFICCRELDRVRVFSRRGHDWTDRVPLIAEALAALRVKSITPDGEGVVCGPDGVSDFDLLRVAVGRKGSRAAFLYAFDVLELDGVDLSREPWETRRATLTSLLRKAADGIRLCEHIEGTRRKPAGARPYNSAPRTRPCRRSNRVKPEHPPGRPMTLGNIHSCRAMESDQRGDEGSLLVTRSRHCPHGDGRSKHGQD
jgi:bifunctional non-homologous end joining protein LigD